MAEWAASYRTTSDRHDDPNDIKNWDLNTFKPKLLSSHLHVPVNSGAILAEFKVIACAAPGTDDQLTAYSSAFALGLQKLRKYNLYSRFTPEAIAQQFFDGLPPLVHYFIPYLDKSSQHVDPTIRTCYEDVQAELTAVKSSQVISSISRWSRRK